MFIFLLQNRHLKPKIDCKNNGKWKLQTCFSPIYDFAFTNLLKNVADMPCKIMISGTNFKFVSITKH